MMAVGGERRAEGGGRNGGASRITESWRVAGMRPVDGDWDEKEGSEEAEQALESVVLVTAWGGGQEVKRPRGAQVRRSLGKAALPACPVCLCPACVCCVWCVFK